VICKFVIINKNKNSSSNDNSYSFGEGCIICSKCASDNGYLFVCTCIDLHIDNSYVFVLALTVFGSCGREYTIRRMSDEFATFMW